LTQSFGIQDKGKPLHLVDVSFDTLGLVTVSLVMALLGGV